MKKEICESLCFTARYAASVKNENLSCFVTTKSYGMILTLCTFSIQEDEALAIPVSTEEASKWNTPLPEMFDIARGNMPGFFGVSIYDLKKGEFADMDWNRDGLYNFEPEEMSLAAEENLLYDGRKKYDIYGIRYRLSFSKTVGCAPLFYPNLMKRISMTSKKDPVILMDDPGEMLIFEGENAALNVKKYIRNKYPDANGLKKEILVYRYLKKNRVLQDLTKMQSSSSKENKEAHIPAGSVHSAWGNTALRSNMYEWRNQKDSEIFRTKKDSPP